MSLSTQMERLMKERKISRYRLSKETGIPYTTLTQIINGKTKDPQVNALGVLADYFKVSVDYLIGESASSIIEERLKEKGMTLEELANKSKVPLTVLQNLDSIVPDQEIDGGEQYYSYMSAIAWILDLPIGRLRAAFARQEIPSDQYPVDISTPEEDFFNENKEELTPTLSTREERDIAKDLEKMLSNLESKEALAFNGEPLDEETKELMRISLESSMRMAKQIAKQKFTPKKYKK